MAVLALAGGAGCFAQPLPAEVPPEPPPAPPVYALQPVPQPPSYYVQPPAPYEGAPSPPEDPAYLVAPGADAPAPGPVGNEEATVEDFYAPLSRYGTWVDVAPYGRVWQPADAYAGADFVPYASDGAWALNADGGWVFESRYDREWGWATYHYGRWVEHDAYGWVWIPGTVWAPSWVEWRYGGGYVGWMPMGPPGAAMVESRWVLVEQQRFVEPGVLAYRLGGDRARSAWLAATPIVEVRAGARWTVGPPFARMQAEGVAIRPARTAALGRGHLREQARASLALRSSARVALAPSLRRGPAAPQAEAREQRPEAREQRPAPRQEARPSRAASRASPKKRK